MFTLTSAALRTSQISCLVSTVQSMAPMTSMHASNSSLVQLPKSAGRKNSAALLSLLNPRHLISIGRFEFPAAARPMTPLVLSAISVWFSANSSTVLMLMSSMLPSPEPLPSSSARGVALAKMLLAGVPRGGNDGVCERVPASH